MLTSQSSRPCSGQILHHEYVFSVTEGQIDACKTSPKREEQGEMTFLILGKMQNIILIETNIND